MTIVKFTDRFLVDVLLIENESFADPWTKEMFLESAKDIYTTFNVIIEGDKVAGYYIYSITIDEINIYIIAVHSNFRRRGYGCEMMKDIIEKSIKAKVRKIFLEVRKSNIAAINMYKSFGFELVSIRKNYYSDNREDALVLIKTNQ
jgi:ribosomal-protein-alanine N-acetyltransferase